MASIVFRIQIWIQKGDHYLTGLIRLQSILPALQFYPLEDFCQVRHTNDLPVIAELTKFASWLSAEVRTLAVWPKDLLDRFSRQVLIQVFCRITGSSEAYSSGSLFSGLLQTPKLFLTVSVNFKMRKRNGHLTRLPRRHMLPARVLEHRKGIAHSKGKHSEVRSRIVWERNGRGNIIAGILIEWQLKEIANRSWTEF